MGDADVSARRADNVAHVASAIAAGHAAVLFALTQLPAMGDWWTTMATYATAVGLPIATASAVHLRQVAAGTASYGERIAENAAPIAGLLLVLGVGGLFGHFNWAVAVCFGVVSCAVIVAALIIQHRSDVF